MKRLAVAVVLSLAAGSCQDIGRLLEGVTKPTVSVADVKLLDLSLRGVKLGFLLDVENPYSVPLPILGLDYALASRGTRFLSGQSDREQLIPAYATGQVPLTAEVGFAEALSALSGVRPGTTFPYAAEIGLFVDAPGAGRLSLPLRHEGELPVPAPPEVNLESIRWGAASPSAVGGVLAVGIVNHNEFPVDLETLNFALTIAGIDVGCAGIERAAAFGPGARQTLEVPISFSPSQAGLALLNLIAGSGSDYSLGGTIRAGTPFGPIEFPIAGAGRTRFSR